jgi:integrase-like protein
VRADGTPLHPDWITALFHRHCERAGLPRIRLHDVRHSYATAALKAGVSPKVISERLGHATVSFTLQTYAHVIPAMDEHAASTVAALILGDRDQDRDRAPIGTMPAVEGQKENWPGTKSQASGGSGGRI